MIKRVIDPKKINDIVNVPEVFKWVAKEGQESLDLTSVVLNLNNILLMDEEYSGGVLLVQLEPGYYEAHTNFLPGTSPEKVRQTLKDVISFMFTKTDCMEIVSNSPQSNFAATKLAHEFMEYKFSRDNAWKDVDGNSQSVSYFSLTFNSWLEEENELLSIGDEFHLELEKVLPFAAHPIDLTHDRYVGMCVLLCRSGQAGKGVLIYNHWARFAGYEVLRLVSLKPAIIDFHSAIAVLNSDQTISFVENK